jgi:chemotaxis regulatin CheY-phosphate phosphatase CheZ
MIGLADLRSTPPAPPVNSFSISSAAPDIVDVEYDAIEAALLKTARGRAFLGEFTRRNRNADTHTVLTAIERLEGAMRANDPVADVQRFRGDVLEMARRIADTRQQLVAMRAEDEADTTIGRAAGELEHIVQATESATSNILGAAEEIQEIAWTLREGGFAVETCEAIDARATNIYLACSFQDLTAQRTRKVIEAMAFLEDRIAQMIDIWGFSAEELTRGPAPAVPLAGPTDNGLEQEEVDLAMVGAARPEPLPDLLESGYEPPYAQPGKITDGAFASDPVETSVVAAPDEAVAIAYSDVSDDIPEEAFEAPVPPREPVPPLATASEQDALDRLAQKLSVIDGMNVRSRIADFE